MNDETPSIAEVRKQYAFALAGDRIHRTEQYMAEFDRMLAEVERAAAEKAWWEGQRAGWEECADPGAFVNDLHDAKTPNPYRKETP